MSYELLSTLPPGTANRTHLAGAAGRQVVLRLLSGDDAQPFLTGPTPKGVLSLLEVTEVNGAKAAVYDYVPGVTLGELLQTLRAAGAVPLGLVARVLVDAGRAVGQLHDSQPPLPAHGGLSDAALLLSFDGQVHVLDYGAARPGRFQPLEAASVQSDVFALGAVLHASLTSFTARYGEAVASGAALPPPSALHPEATDAVDALVTRALSRDVAGRPADGKAFADELQAAVGEALMSSAAVAEVLGRHFTTPLPPALDAQAEAPTGAHVAPWLKPAPSPAPPAGQPAPMVPWVTGTTGSGLPAVQPLSADTEPGREGPFANLIPAGTEPAGEGPFLEERAAPTHPEMPQLDRLEIPRLPRAFATRLEGPPAVSERGEVDLDHEEEPTGPGDLPPAPGGVPELGLGEEDTDPRAPAPVRRNTTEEERRRARGQEVILTPPAGLPAASPTGRGDDEADDEPDDSSERTQISPHASAPSADKGPSAPSESPSERDTSKNPRFVPGGRKAIAALMVLLAVGLGAMVVWRLGQPASHGAEPVPVDVAPQGPDASVPAAAEAVGAAVERDAG